MFSRKSRIRLLLKRRSHNSLAAYARRTYDGLLANALYPSPTVPLPVYLSKINAMKSAIAAWGTVHNRGSRNDYVVLLAARAELELALVKMRAYCEGATVHDGRAFINAGWEIRNSRSASEVLHAPQNFRQIYQKNVPSGSALLKCNKVKGAHIYMFFREAVGAETHGTKYYSTRSHIIITPLIPGELYRFYVVALGAKGEGVRSDVCEVRVL